MQTQCWSDRSCHNDVSNSWLLCYWYPCNVWKHQEDNTCIPNLLAPHKLTGCNTSATYFGSGKGMITLKPCVQGSTHFDTNKQVLSIIHQAQCFLLACYGQVNCKSLSNTGKCPKARVTACNQWVFQRKRSPYTSIQATIWRNIFVTHPPPLDATKYGWSKDEDSWCFAPEFPPFKLQMKCWSSSSTPTNSNEQLCISHRFGSKNSSLTCTMFGLCQGDNTCHNHTLQTQQWGGEED